MDENIDKKTSQHTTWFVIAIIIFLIIGWTNSSSKASELEYANEELSSEVVTWQDEADILKRKLEQANDNIDEANSTIEYASGQAWEDYETMGHALENMPTVETVDY